MKKISSRKFIFCYYNDKEVPKQDGGCCDYYDGFIGKCGYRQSRISRRHLDRLSEREENYRSFNQHQSEEE